MTWAWQGMRGGVGCGLLRWAADKWNRVRVASSHSRHPLCPALPPPRRLWPVAAHGFRDLSTRSRVQAEAVAENANRLRELQVGLAGEVRRVWAWAAEGWGAGRTRT